MHSNPLYDPRPGSAPSSRAGAPVIFAPPPPHCMSAHSHGARANATTMAAVDEDDERPRRRCRCCLRATPWVPILSSAVIAAALVVFCVFSARGAAEFAALLAELGTSLPADGALRRAVAAADLAAVALLASALALAVLAATGSGTHRTRRLGECSTCARPGRCATRACLTFSAAHNVATWLASAAAVALLVVYAALAAGAWVEMHEATVAASGAGAARAAADANAGGALGSTAHTAAVAVQRGVAAAVASAPPAVAATPWFAAVVVGELSLLANQSALLAGGVPTCPARCLRMATFAALVGLSGDCLCSPPALAAVQARWAGMFTALAAQAAALAALAAAASWLALDGVGGFSYFKADLRRECGGGGDARRVASDGHDATRSAAAAAAAAAVAATTAVMTSDLLGGGGGSVRAASVRGAGSVKDSELWWHGGGGGRRDSANGGGGGDVEESRDADTHQPPFPSTLQLLRERSGGFAYDAHASPPQQPQHQPPSGSAEQLLLTPGGTFRERWPSGAGSMVLRGEHGSGGGTF